MISVVMPTYNTPREYLTAAIDSVLAQYYPHWELCVCDDASSAPYVREVLEAYAAKDNRVKVTFSASNGGISSASNHALALTTGDYIALLDHDDELTPDALYEVAAVLQLGDADLIYSDEDKLDDQGRRCEPFFKPAWSPDLTMSANYVSHFGVYRKRIVDELGGFDKAFDGSQDYDLMLRFVEHAGLVAHVPKILYHWRKTAASAASGAEAKPWAYEAATRAITSALVRRGITGEVERETPAGFYRVRRLIAKPGKVSIVITTIDRVQPLQRCIDSITSTTEYQNYEIIIVDLGSQDLAHLDYLERTPHQVLRYDGLRNASRFYNLAAAKTDGDYLLLLQDDTEVLYPGWLEAMVEHAQRQEVGAVGAKLLYPDGRVQHAGMILGGGSGTSKGGVAQPYQGFYDGLTASGYSNFGKLVRNCGAVSGACLMIRREVFQAVGGMSERLAASFNDVDLCLRLRAQGYLIVFTPYAVLRHHTSHAQEERGDPRAEAYMTATWGRDLTDDPYYHPSLDLSSSRFDIDILKPDSWYRMYSQKESTLSERLVVGRPLGQSFDASDGLCSIGLLFAKKGHPLVGTLRFHLSQSPRAQLDLRIVEVEASSISDDQYYQFDFDPVYELDGTQLYFYVEILEPLDDGILMIRKKSTTDPKVGPFYRQHEPGGGTLAFEAYCLKPLSRLTQNDPRALRGGAA